MNEPSLEVIVPAYNASADIADCIAALLRAGMAPGEIIVVDDGSDDPTRQIALNAGVRMLEAKDNLGASAARDLGARHATAPILLFVDSDVIVSPDTKQRVMSAFENTEISAVFGAYDSEPSAPGLVSQYRNLLHRYVHVTGPKRPKTFWTGLGAVRRDAYLQVGGFDPEQRMMEDVEFGLRLTANGHAIALDPELTGRHRKSWSLIGMIRTDLFDRALPWTRLIKQRGMSKELNLSLRNRISAVSALLLVVCLLIALVHSIGWAVGIIALLGFVLSNLDFLKSLSRTKGPAFAIASIGPHFIHTWCAILGFAWVILIEGAPGERRQYQDSKS